MKEPPKPSIETVLEHLGGRAFGNDRGGWRKATCPIHDDKNPSASLNESECRFHCFTCDFSGDAIDLIREVTGAGWADAVAVAEGFVDGSSEPVRGGGRSSGLLPKASGHRQGRSNFSQPWLRL